MADLHARNPAQLPIQCRDSSYETASKPRRPFIASLPLHYPYTSVKVLVLVRESVSVMPSTPSSAFSTIPILPLSQALDPATKPQFLKDLRSALLNVGVLYLSDTGLPERLVQHVVAECRHFFEKLPLEEKERIEMKNEKSFLGWSRVSDSASSIISPSVRRHDIATYQNLCETCLSMLSTEQKLVSNRLHLR